MQNESTPWHNKLKNWFIRHKNKIGLIAIGHTAKQTEEYLVDWFVYGFVVFKCTSIWGPYKGSIVAFFIMMPISALLCWLYIVFYDWAKKDIFGFEALKELREEESSGWFGRLFQRISRWGDIPVFILLTTHSDPFMVTMYFRKKGHAHKGLAPRDWYIFWGSVVLSNAYWTFGWTIVLWVIEALWSSLHAIL